jgi:hypothetical protein
MVKYRAYASNPGFFDFFVKLYSPSLVPAGPLAPDETFCVPGRPVPVHNVIGEQQRSRRFLSFAEDDVVPAASKTPGKSVTFA